MSELDNDASKENIKLGEYVTWIFEAKNKGPNIAKNVKVYIKLADDLKFIKYNVNKGIFIPKTGIWNIGDLKPGQNLVLSIVTQATTTGEKVTKAFLKSDTHITTPDEIYEEEEINVEDKHHSSDTTNNVNTHKVASNTVATSAYKTAFPIGLLVLSIFAIFVTSIKRIV